MVGQGGATLASPRPDTGRSPTAFKVQALARCTWVSSLPLPPDKPTPAHTQSHSGHRMTPNDSLCVLRQNLRRHPKRAVPRLWCRGVLGGPGPTRESRELRSEKSGGVVAVERVVFFTPCREVSGDEGSRHTSRTRGRTMSSSSYFFTTLNALPLSSWLQLKKSQSPGS